MSAALALGGALALLEPAGAREAPLAEAPRIVATEAATAEAPATAPFEDEAAALEEELLRRLNPMDTLAPALSEVPEGDELMMLSKNAMSVIGSMVSAFLKNEKLTAEQKQCLERSSQKFVGKVMLVSSHIVMLVQEVMGERTDPHMPGLPDSSAIMKPMQALTLKTGVTDEDDEEVASRRLGDELSGANILLHMASIFMELGTSLQMLVQLGHAVASECVQGEVLEALHKAGAHVRDIKYVAGHFLANGADVVEEFAHGALAYKAGNYSQFGSQIGNGLRKILLSKNPSAHLPEGQVGKQMMVNMSMGFVKGFFGEGFTLGIRLKQDPEDPLRVDLEDCIANNMAFFEQIWSALAYAYIQRSASQPTGDSANNANHQQPKEGNAQLGTALAVAAMEFPDALHRCGVGRQQADMLIDSIKAFGEGMQFTISTPNELRSNDEITKDIGRTVQDWGKLAWRDFGFDLGLLLQELVLTLFPRKYEVGDLGLRSRLDEISPEAGGLGSSMPGYATYGPALPFLALGIPFAFVAVAGVWRKERVRLQRHARLSLIGEDDIEVNWKDHEEDIIAQGSVVLE